MTQTPIFARRFVQVLFAGMAAAIGIKFHLFVSLLEQGGIPGFERPAGVEAFLPISALVSFKHWIYTGTINTVHPSALVLFLIICATAVVAKKGFCSWGCPIGFLSEGLANLNKNLFRKAFRLPAIFDLLLRSLKYLIAGFFIYQIFYKMPVHSIEAFIRSPYNQFADIKMLKFFTNMTLTALMVFLLLISLSILIQNFWCRYLCPYGALLGIIGFFSLGKICRNPANCTHCGRCEAVCPGKIRIRQKTMINSPECSSCLSCIEYCPEKDTLRYNLFHGRQSLTATSMAVFFVLIFVAGITMAKVSGHWQNNISLGAYLRYTAPSNPPSSHQVSEERMERMILMMKQFKTQQMHSTQQPEENEK